MKKNDGWINALFSLVFIATPALILYFFYLPTWSGNDDQAYWVVWVIALLFMVYVVVLSYVLIKFEWLTIESLNFNIPITLALMAIMVTYTLPLWATAIITLAMVMVALPVNMWTTRFRNIQISKLRRGK